MQPRLTLHTLPPSIHGARDHAELTQLGLNPDSVLDFSDNINPYGPHPAVLKAVQAAATGPTLARYPDKSCLALTQAIAAAENVSANWILPTNGASELIHLIALAFVSRGSRHIILTPTFGEYTRAIQLLGGAVYEYRADAPALRFDANTVAAEVRRLRPDGVWLCNPNNPTGQHWTQDDLRRIYAAAPDALWVLDESYRYFTVGKQQRRGNTHHPSTITIRSLTKEQGLAGLRLGYAVAAPPLLNALKTVQPPWSVNSLAQVAGVAALQPEVITWRDSTLAQLRRHAANLWAGLRACGFSVLSGATAYALIKVGAGAEFRRWLLRQEILVRDCASFGLPEYIRVAARLPAENEQLLAAVKEIVPFGVAAPSFSEQS